MTKNSPLPTWVLIGSVFATLFLQSCSGGSGEPQQTPASTIKSITIFPSSASLKPGDTQQYTAVVRDSNNNIRDNVTVTWSTVDPAIATINAQGLLTAHQDGPTDVQATHQSIKSQVATVLVLADPVSQLAPLPPWLSYCSGACQTQLAPVVASLCPSGTPGCTPARSTIVSTQVDGEPVTGVLLAVLHAVDPYPHDLPGTTLRVVSGDGDAFNGAPKALAAYTAAAVRLSSDTDLRVTSYGVPPVWHGTTVLNFESTVLTAPGLTTVFYRHPSFDTGSASQDIHRDEQEIMRIERDLTGITTAEPVTAYYLPTELSATRLGEGTFSFGNGTVTINYVFPLYLDSFGGLRQYSLARFSHEYAHELFNEASGWFFGNYACLNEGLADATGFASGFLPEQDFGPIGLQAFNFEEGCLKQQMGVHDRGNCIFWNLKQAGYLTPATIHGLFHPQHTFFFDSCTFNQETGNSYLVYLTEATGGANMIPVLDKTKIPHATSYAEAKAQLGL